MSVRAVLRTGALLLLSAPLRAQAPEEQRFPRWSLAGGMGVAYLRAGDIADYATALSGRRMSDFTTAVDFFGAADVPLSARWVLSAEYSYLLGGINDLGPGTELTFRAHLPTLLVRYVLVEEERYNVRVGPGVGYHAGTLTVRYGTIAGDYSGSGPGLKLDVEANTALGENLFARLGVDLRWEFIGALRDAGGGELAAPLGADAPTLHWFSAGARLGATWYF